MMRSSSTSTKRGFYLVGIENGEVVGAVSAVMTPGTAGGPPFGFIGFFIVKLEHRKKGLGKQLFDAALSRLSPCSTIGLDAVLAQAPRYASLGFVARHANVRFSCAATPSVPADPGVLTNAPPEAIVAYDAPFYPGERFAFAAGWWSHPAHFSRAILGARGEVQGYGVVCPSEAGWRIGPLFADAPTDAARLYAHP
ncbi:acyl-CoA N-acyltransferase [Baffinella frigidus]|nr:acyl-CoA N-acyltransferase [Cryptophyta sp. CCMP2293]